MNWKAIIAAALLSATGAVLAADDARPAATTIKPEAIREKNLLAGKVKLDPAKGYVFSSYSTPFLGTFVRVPDQEDWDTYRADWEAAFAKAEKKYASEYKVWEQRRKTALEMGTKVPSRPKKVTRETFSIEPIELRMMVSFGPGDEFSKDKAKPSYSYLTAMKPGTYVWYGVFTPSVLGSCFCMGSVKFEVKPGVITDLGNFLLAVIRYDGLTMDDKLNAMPGRFSNSPDGQGENGPDQAVFGAIPGSLGALPVVRAEFHAAGKMNNIFALMISRVRPIPGIIAYRRGEVVDLRTGQVISMQIAPFNPDAALEEEDDGGDED